MNFKKLSLAAILSGAFVLTGCPTDDTGGTGDTDDTETPTTMTMTDGTMTQGTMTTTGPTTTGPSTTDPDTTETATDTMDTDTDTETDSDTTGPDPDVYDFREDGADAYAAVDRMGFPAVNTALIAEANKDAYNASNPAADVTAGGTFAGDAVASVQFLHNGTGDDSTGLRDDFALANDLLGTTFTPCGVSKLNNSCFQQAVPLAFPDVIAINTNNPSGFPNGRDLATPVIDVVLAALLLQIDEQADFGQLADLDPADDEVHGLSQSPNDVAFPGAFPYLAAAHEAK